MKIFAIGDLHFSGEPPTKPMDVFGPHWQNHRERIIASWLEQVSDEDIVFVVGDTSWALRLAEAVSDLKAIAQLPGQIYLIRGNHDYWWSSAKKMDTAMQHELTFLQGHGTAIGHIAFGGTRGYLCPNDTSFEEADDTSIYARELLRTEAALNEMEQALRKSSSVQAPIRILLLHYPPFNDKNEPSGFTELLAKYKVDHCIFGHLHDKNSFDRIPETFGNTKLHLVSADYMDFKLKQIL
ncbi:MAG: serine/threonine protein phosphatase [Veillonella sp.]|uniref:metallophosphoesterase n=1 Tax=Veillonella sp. TaxID=1926307 RepID=UPI0025FAA7C0|nr:metallophosphoesterase [Veillonella sp.]MBE6080348.1 serine/threonine protein phosphatase [Veillonella sp.]